MKKFKCFSSFFSFSKCFSICFENFYKFPEFGLDFSIDSKESFMLLIDVLWSFTIRNYFHSLQMCLRMFDILHFLAEGCQFYPEINLLYKVYKVISGFNHLHHSFITLNLSYFVLKYQN